MTAKLILHEAIHCPYCWAVLCPGDKEHRKRRIGFFTGTSVFWKCSCGEYVYEHEAISTVEPQPALWARRLTL